MTSTTATPAQRDKEFVRRRRFRLVSIGLLLAFAALAIDAIYVEPYRIEVTHYEINGTVKGPLKIAHLSDIHTHGINRREREIFDILDREKPDLIVMSDCTRRSGCGSFGATGKTTVCRIMNAPTIAMPGLSFY